VGVVGAGFETCRPSYEWFRNSLPAANQHLAIDICSIRANVRSLDSLKERHFSCDD
jgi:hypothetical protein